MPRSLFNLL